MEPLLLLAILICPLAMGVMMLVMWRGMGGRASQPRSTGRLSLPEHKAEQARLTARIESLERGGPRPPERDVAAPRGGSRT